MIWKYKNEDQVEGPVSTEELSGLYRSGVIHHDTELLQEGQDTWKRFSDFFEVAIDGGVATEKVVSGEQEVKERVCAYSKESCPEHLMQFIDGKWIANKHLPRFYQEWLEKRKRVQMAGWACAGAFALLVVVSLGLSIRQSARISALGTVEEVSLEEFTAQVQAEATKAKEDLEQVKVAAAERITRSEADLSRSIAEAKAELTGLLDRLAADQRQGTVDAAALAAASQVDAELKLQALLDEAFAKLSSEEMAEAAAERKAVVQTTRDILAGFGLEELEKESRLGFEAGLAWVLKPANLWPQFILGNHVVVRHSGIFAGGGSMLVQDKDGFVHGLGDTLPFSPERNSAAVEKVVSLLPERLDSWEMYPPGSKEAAIEFKQVAGSRAEVLEKSEALGGHVLLSHGMGPGLHSLTPLKLGSRPAEAGESVYLVTRKKGSGSQHQSITYGAILQVDGSGSEMEVGLRHFDPTIDFRGCPIVATNGLLVGIVTEKMAIEPRLQMKGLGKFKAQSLTTLREAIGSGGTNQFTSVMK